MKLRIDSGVEMWLPWARRRAARFVAFVQENKMSFMRRISSPASGVTVIIDVAPDGVRRISITGGLDGGYFSDGSAAASNHWLWTGTKFIAYGVNPASTVLGTGSLDRYTFAAHDSGVAGTINVRRRHRTAAVTPATLSQNAFLPYNYALWNRTSTGGNDLTLAQLCAPYSTNGSDKPCVVSEDGSHVWSKYVNQVPAVFDVDPAQIAEESLPFAQWTTTTSLVERTSITTLPAPVADFYTAKGMTAVAQASAPAVTYATYTTPTTSSAVNNALTSIPIVLGSSGVGINFLNTTTLGLNISLLSGYDRLHDRPVIAAFCPYVSRVDSHVNGADTFYEYYIGVAILLMYYDYASQSWLLDATVLDVQWIYLRYRENAGNRIELSTFFMADVPTITQSSNAPSTWKTVLALRKGLSTDVAAVTNNNTYTVTPVADGSSVSVAYVSRSLKLLREGTSYVLPGDLSTETNTVSLSAVGANGAVLDLTIVSGSNPGAYWVWRPDSATGFSTVFTGVTHAELVSTSGASGCWLSPGGNELWTFTAASGSLTGSYWLNGAQTKSYAAFSSLPSVAAMSQAQRDLYSSSPPDGFWAIDPPMGWSYDTKNQGIKATIYTQLSSALSSATWASKTVLLQWNADSLSWKIVKTYATKNMDTPATEPTTGSVVPAKTVTDSTLLPAYLLPQSKYA